ncbi:helix-hairpin-helix domain-containing protein [Reichenbachiella agarivorans]|uniref:Helix-hairpin-helix domain-containing protein n=1 Tax=Reichenbachiella agarivorans TaxID=2979464 RepID=A0ABY6CKK8_9BACT|nr:helix-hairpin-helix domain-containing protein [Reichenbachiella agarivorans]UXP30934.1 helix-hairpin-helix domain-containing protein [Reichenbachiella agarivorans]
MNRWVQILSMVLWPTAIFAQYPEPDRPQIDIQTFIEGMFQVPDEDINYDDLYESLYQLYLNPIDLNRTNKSELNSLYQLNILQINNLIDYLDQHGPMTSIYELQVIEGFDVITIENILPFVVVRGKDDYQMQGNLLQRITHEENSYFILRAERNLEDKHGYTRIDSGGYVGSPYKLYGRFQSRHSKDFSVGFTFEKDPGEQVIWDSKQKQYGFDYYSYHLFLENKGSFKKISIGDYQMQFGQGLILGSGFNPGKGTETITTVKRGNSGIRPYSSVLESGFMRGAAFTYTVAKRIDISPFYSHIRQDGNIQTATDSESYEEYVSSILETGFHRTYTELENRNKITEDSYGVNLTYNDTHSRNFQGGITYMASHYSHTIQKTPNNYNQYEFKGKYNYNVGLFANYNWHNILLFGEAAQSRSGGRAYVAGFMSSLSPIVSLSFVYRDYDKDFHSFYGNSFSEGSRTINEKGMYWGLKITPSKRWVFAAFYDYFSFPWLRYRAEAPSSGYEYLLKTEYRPSRSVNLYLQYREQSKERTIAQENENIKRLVAGIKRSLAANLDYHLNPALALKSRVQYSSYDLDANSTSGIAIIQDVNVRISKFRISTRFAIFDTEDYDNRQYVYEKDLLYAFSIPAYSGIGTRSYVMLQYNPTRKLTLWTKYGRYHYDEQIESIGSSNERIDGNIKSEIKFQIRYKL